MSVLETDRLVLRPLTLADADALLEVLGDRVAMQHYPAPKDRVQVEAWIRGALASYERNGFGLWAVVRKRDGAVLGDCGPMLQPVEGRQTAEIGYHIVHGEWGRGYATEAARASLEWVFRETDQARVCSIVGPGNAASRRVAEKVHRALRMFRWEKTGTEQCLYWTDRSALAEVPLAAARKGLGAGLG
jgi:RimJ/RimL family protein N-acetyltransferase